MIQISLPKSKNAVSVIAAVMIFTFFFGVQLTKKQPIVIKKGADHTKLAAELVEKAGFKIYPNSKVLNGVLTQSPLPGKKEGEKQLTTFVYLWLETSDDIQNVRNFYKKKIPYVVSEKKIGDNVMASQLSSVTSYAQAVQSGKSKISFMEIRRQAMPEVEREKLKAELEKLSRTSFRTPPQNRRLFELEKLLVKETLVKITLRLLYI